MVTVRLSVSGRDLILNRPTGSEEVLLLESAPDDPGLALALVARLARPTDGAPIDWDTLCVTDLDALVLRLRQLIFGDLIGADVTCPAPACGRRFDVAFRIEDYLAHYRPRPARGVEPAAEIGWFRLGDRSATFRLPTGADQVAIAHRPQPRRELIRRCVRPAGLPLRTINRVERALEALAPNLSREVDGICPECGATVQMFFDAQQFGIRELRNQAAFVYEDVHLLAERYHWTEADILALPRHRRAQYAEYARHAEQSGQSLSWQQARGAG